MPPNPGTILATTYLTYLSAIACAEHTRGPPPENGKKSHALTWSFFLPLGTESLGVGPIDRGKPVQRKEVELHGDAFVDVDWRGPGWATAGGEDGVVQSDAGALFDDGG